MARQQQQNSRIKRELRVSAEMHIHTHTHTHACVSTHKHKDACASVQARARLHARPPACAHARTHAHTLTRGRAYMRSRCVVSPTCTGGSFSVHQSTSTFWDEVYMLSRQVDVVKGAGAVSGIVLGMRASDPLRLSTGLRQGQPCSPPSKYII